MNLEEMIAMMGKMVKQESDDITEAKRLNAIRESRHENNKRRIQEIIQDPTQGLPSIDESKVVEE